jgi:transposase
MAARRGRKRRAKTDNADCDLQLRLLLAGELPESWIPPAQILELRTLVRLRKTLIDQRTAWQQRIHAQLFHQGMPAGLKLRTESGREGLRPSTVRVRHRASRSRCKQAASLKSLLLDLATKVAPSWPTPPQPSFRHLQGSGAELT